MGFSQINCLYLCAQIIWAFPTSFSCSDTDKKTEGAQMRLKNPVFARADKGSLSEGNPHYLRADNMGFSQINTVQRAPFASYYQGFVASLI